MSISSQPFAGSYIRASMGKCSATLDITTWESNGERIMSISHQWPTALQVPHPGINETLLCNIENHDRFAGSDTQAAMGIALQH